MAKFSGLVGYVEEKETVPGVWTPVETPISMKGDIIRQASSFQEEGKVNPNVSLNHRVSLIGDSYSFKRYYQIRYIVIDDVKWAVASVELQRPRIILTLGGVYNG